MPGRGRAGGGVRMRACVGGSGWAGGRWVGGVWVGGTVGVACGCYESSVRDAGSLWYELTQVA